MSDNRGAVLVSAQVMCASIEMEAMKAANYVSQMKYETVVYAEEDFMALIDKHSIGFNAVQTILRSYE